MDDESPGRQVLTNAPKLHRSHRLSRLLRHDIRGNVMFRKIWKNRVLRYPLFGMVFVALGYFSNSVTLAACERQTTSWLKQVLSENPTDWPHRRASHDPAEYTYPWIVTVDYDWAVGSTGAETGTWYYVSVFGIAIPLGDEVSVMA